VAAADAFVADGAWVSHLALADATWVLASVDDRNPAAIARGRRSASRTA
jgi:hypothetical protein